MINNLRDIPGDTIAGKKTLAVRLGDRRTRQIYLALLVVSAIAIVVLSLDNPFASLGLIGLLAAIPAIRQVTQGAAGKDLIAVLGTTGRTQMLTALTLSIGILLA